jgi:hypothetical protein
MPNPPKAQWAELAVQKRIADARAVAAKNEQAVLDVVAVAWHNLAPQLVALAHSNGDALFTWAQAQALLADALALPEAHHTCSGTTCKFGYAHAAGL